LIFNLNEIAAFAGTYKATEASRSLGQDFLTVYSQETKVMMALNPFGEMVELKVADEGIKVKLKE